MRARHIAESASTAPSVSSVGALVPDELHAAIILFYSLLDERQTLHLSRSKAATAVTAVSPNCSVSTPVPWPEDASNCSPGRSSAFKYALQTRLADPYGLRVTICCVVVLADSCSPQKLGALFP